MIPTKAVTDVPHLRVEKTPHTRTHPQTKDSLQEAPVSDLRPQRDINCVACRRQQHHRPLIYGAAEAALCLCPLLVNAYHCRGSFAAINGLWNSLKNGGVSATLYSFKLEIEQKKVVCDEGGGRLERGKRVIIYLLAAVKYVYLRNTLLQPKIN